MLDTIVKDLLKAVHETQGQKPHKIQVTTPMKTPTGEIINVPIEKVDWYKALGLSLEEA